MTEQLRIFIDGLLPWDRIKSVENRFLALMVIFLLLALLFIIMVKLVEVPKVDRKEQQIPDRLAKLVMEKKIEEPPPPPEPEPEPEEKEEEPEPEPEKEPKPEPEKPKEKKEIAKEKAKEEIKQVEDALADLREFAAPVVQRPLTTAGAQSAQISRDLITSRAGKGSGGIKIAAVSSGGGGGGTLAAAPQQQLNAEIPDQAVERKKSKDGKLHRSKEEIRRAIDRHKAALDGIYRRALRQNPALEGTLVVKIVIQPDGKISDARIVSSELDDPALERKLLIRIKRITFEPAQVEVWEGEVPFNFYPS